MKKLLPLFILILLIISTKSTRAEEPVAAWRIPTKQATTLIADLDYPAIYKICFPRENLPNEWYGYVRPLIDGGVGPVLTPGSCMLVKARNIGLRKWVPSPQTENHFHGTYQRVEPLNWSKPSDWSYLIQPNQEVIPDQYILAYGIRGIYRICQENIFIDPEPLGPALGYYLQVDGLSVQLQNQSAPPTLMRFDTASCVDVDGKDITVIIKRDEINPNLRYQPKGDFRFAPDGVVQ